MPEDRRKQPRGCDRRNHTIRNAIEELYTQIYIPNYNNTQGIGTIGQKYIQGCSEEVRVEVTMLAVSDAKLSPQLKRSLRDFALLLVKKKIVILEHQISQEDLCISGF